MAGWLTPGFPLVGSATYPTMTGAELLPLDSQRTGGGFPQTVAANLVTLAAFTASMTASTATSTVHAATLNTSGGLVTTEALTTAANATYTFTLTNSLLVAGAPAPTVSMAGLTNTGGIITLTSVTNAVGSTVIVWTNTGTTAFNGTMLIAFHV